MSREVTGIFSKGIPREDATKDNPMKGGQPKVSFWDSPNFGSDSGMPQCIVGCPKYVVGCPKWDGHYQEHKMGCPLAVG